MSCNRQIALSSYASGLTVGAAVTATTVLLAKKLFGLNTGSEVMYCAFGGAAGVCMGAWVGRAVAGAVLARKQTWTVRRKVRINWSLLHFAPICIAG